jgi:hypothetical protein
LLGFQNIAVKFSKNVFMVVNLRNRELLGLGTGEKYILANLKKYHRNAQS